MQGKKYVYLFDEGNGEMKDLLGGQRGRVSRDDKARTACSSWVYHYH